MKTRTQGNRFSLGCSAERAVIAMLSSLCKYQNKKKELITSSFFSRSRHQSWYCHQPSKKKKMYTLNDLYDHDHFFDRTKKVNLNKEKKTKFSKEPTY
jgi:hypothetical protein